LAHGKRDEKITQVKLIKPIKTPEGRMERNQEK
jgi:hypothetical protein